MGEALYRKYRSKSLSEIVGQEHITDTLKNAIKTKRISHAYLFTGPRGVGKTSIARILAYQLNDIPYELESSKHMDIIEIDAASNRRIDEIRELRDKVHIAPTSGTYKVYIIDEVHMLTKEAFNALLKTLEEPPSHVIFILATTEAHKLPETIISRTQRYSFKPVPHTKVVDHLKTIAKSEKITIDDKALGLIAAHGEGSFRDSISLLDQVSSIADSITEDHVRGVIGVPPTNDIQQIITAIFANDIKLLNERLTALYDQNYQAHYIAKETSKLLRWMLLNQKLSNTQSATALTLMKNLLNTASSPDPRSYLEITLYDSISLQHQTPEPISDVNNPPASEPPQEKNQDTLNIPAEQSPNNQTMTEVEPPAKSTKDSPPVNEKPNRKKAAKPTSKQLTEQTWQEVLGQLKGRHNTLYGIARMAKASVDGSTVTLAFAFAFHQRRCAESRNKQKIVAVLKEISGQDVELACVVDPSVKTPTDKAGADIKAAPKAPKSDTLESIINVFGGGEVLE